MEMGMSMGSILLIYLLAAQFQRGGGVKGR